MGARPGGAGEAPDILDQLYFTSECHLGGLRFSSEEKVEKNLSRFDFQLDFALCEQICLVRVKPGRRPWRRELLRRTVGQSIPTL